MLFGEDSAQSELEALSRRSLAVAEFHVVQYLRIQDC